MKSGGKPVDTRVTVTLSFLSVEDGIIINFFNFVISNLNKIQLIFCTKQTNLQVYLYVKNITLVILSVLWYS